MSSIIEAKLLTELQTDQERYRPFKTLEEERAFVKLNIENLDFVKRVLIDKTLGLAYSLAKKYKNYVKNFDDAIQNAVLGLCDAAERFDFINSETARFSSYAFYRIKNSILKEMRNTDPFNHIAVSLDEVFETDDGPERDYYNYIEQFADPTFLKSTDILDEFDKEDTGIILEKLISAVNATDISTFHKQVFNELLIKRTPINEVANKLKTSYANINNSYVYLKRVVLTILQSDEFKEVAKPKVEFKPAKLFFKTPTAKTNKRAKKSNYKMTKTHTKPVLQIDNVTGEVIAEFPSIKDASKKTKTSYGSISHVCCGIQKTAKGYYWKFKE